MLSNLTHDGEALEQTSIAVSSMVDTWQRIAALKAEFAPEEAEIKQNLLVATASDDAWTTERARLDGVRGDEKEKSGRSNSRRATKADRDPLARAQE